MATKPIAPCRRQRTAAFFIDLDEAQYSVVSHLARSAGLESFYYSTKSADCINWDSPAVIAIKVTRISDLGAVRDVRSIRPDLPVIIVTANSTEELAIDSLRAGANEYLRCPSSDSIIKA